MGCIKAHQVIQGQGGGDAVRGNTPDRIASCAEEGRSFHFPELDPWRGGGACCCKKCKLVRCMSRQDWI